MFYTDTKRVIINNGHLFESFSIERGARQGCPLSSFLFLICIETMSNLIAKCQDITGLNITNNTIKQTLFADNATFFNNGNETSFNKLISTKEQIGKSSGLKIKYSKTLIFQVGSLKNKHIKSSENSQFTLTSSSANTLVITFTNN